MSESKGRKWFEYGIAFLFGALVQHSAGFSLGELKAMLILIIGVGYLIACYLHSKRSDPSFIGIVFGPVVFVGALAKSAIFEFRRQV